MFTNQWESLTLASTTEADRSQWILTINSTIKHAEDSLMGYAMLVHPDPRAAAKNASAKIDPLAARKYFILSNNLLTYHPDEQKTSEIEGLINVNEHTVLDDVNDDQRLISLIDSDAQRSKLTFQFKAMNIGAESTASQYQRWKVAIFSMTKPRFNNPTTDVIEVGGNALHKAATRRRSKQFDHKPTAGATDNTEPAPLRVETREMEEVLPPLPDETPPVTPAPQSVPPPPTESPATPGTGRSSVRKVAFLSFDTDEEDANDGNPRAGRSRGNSRAGSDLQDSTADGDEGEGASKKVVITENALKSSVERRKSRRSVSATAAVTPPLAARKSIARGSVAGGLLGTKERTRSISAGSLQRTSSASLLDFSLLRTNSSNALEGVLGQLTAAEILRAGNRQQPLTKQLFDNYSKEDMLELHAIQQLCYEVGVYYSFMEVKIQMKRFVNGGGMMSYENFVKFWNANPMFRCVLLTGSCVWYC